MQVMAKYALSNVIPLGAPGTRRPSGHIEPELRVSLGFCPKWFASRVGVDFSERFHTDPVYRYGRLLEMKHALHSLFPNQPEFQPRQLACGAEDGCATISGVYGIKLITRLYGQPILYKPDNWPEGAPDFRLAPRDIANSSPIELDSHPVMAELETQMDILEREFGIIDGFVNYQGVLNIAFALCGSDIFLSMADDPEEADAVFTHIADTMLRLAKRVQARQRRSGFSIDLLSVSNCVMNMISPADYERFILPRDIWLSEAFPRFGVHTCNWNASPYLDSIRKIDKVGYIDMGIQSDMARARELFPDARRAVFYTPDWVERKVESDLAADIAKIHNGLGACDIVLADLPDTASDDRIRLFLALVEARAGEGEV